MAVSLALLRQRLDGKEFAIGFILFITSWILILICVCPIPWYSSTSHVECFTEDGTQVDDKQTFMVTLWSYKTCDIIPLECGRECANRSWKELWKVGCGSSGPRGQELYCFDFDTAGEMTAAFLLLALIIGAALIPFIILRKTGRTVRYLSQGRVSMIIVTGLAFSWSCCIMTWMWYPFISNASYWKEQNPGTSIHLSYGWYCIMIVIPIMFFSIICMILDHTKACNTSGYEETQ